ncbi:MAG: hypothetical protein WCE79_05170 [Xanthobacteraceae bacterium]
MRSVIALAALAMLSSGAEAQSLKVVEVSAPAINCVFNASCTITVSDTVGNILLPTVLPGTAWLQSRTFSGQPGTPAAGLTGYEYRISLTQASGQAECITGFTMNFGPHKPLPYKDATLADVFVVTGGGLGTISLKSAMRFGDVIEFTLKSPLCLNGTADIKNTTFFIGLAAEAAPMHVNSQISVIGMVPIYAADARVPTHTVAPDPPGGL